VNQKEGMESMEVMKDGGTIDEAQLDAHTSSTFSKHSPLNFNSPSAPKSRPFSTPLHPSRKLPWM
jgi:hypothetical protein